MPSSFQSCFPFGITFVFRAAAVSWRNEGSCELGLVARWVAKYLDVIEPVLPCSVARKGNVRELCAKALESGCVLMEQLADLPKSRCHELCTEGLQTREHLARRKNQ